MKKYSLIILFASLAIAGCSKQDLQEEQAEISQQESVVVVENPIQFVANADESGDTKTYLDKTNVKWSSGDVVRIYGTDSESESVNGDYAVASSGSTSADLTYNESGHEFGEGDEPQYAIYPSSKATGISGSTISFTLPATQTYAAGSFANNANIAVGKVTGTSSTKSIAFKNVCSYLKLQVYMERGCAKVGKVVLTSKENVPISGDCSVVVADDQAAATCTGGNTITLDCSSYGESSEGAKDGGVDISTDSESPTAFYFVVPATSFGFTAEIYSTQDNVIKTLETTGIKDFARTTVKPITKQSMDAFTDVDYLQSSGVQGINTGIEPDWEVDNHMIVKIQPIFPITQRNLMGLHSSNPYFGWRNHDKYGCVFENSNTPIESLIIEEGKTYNVDYKITNLDAILSVDDNVLSTASSNGWATRTSIFYLLQIYNFYAYTCSAKLYSAKIVQNEIDKFNGTPAVCQKGYSYIDGNTGETVSATAVKPGLYDSVTGNFFVNLGKGADFTYGTK